jgi:hypothetical protein
MVSSSVYRICRLRGLGITVKGSDYIRAHGSGFRVQGAGLRYSDFRFRV